jgi:hypothetical protein
VRRGRAAARCDAPTSLTDKKKGTPDPNPNPKGEGGGAPTSLAEKKKGLPHPPPAGGGGGGAPTSLRLTSPAKAMTKAMLAMARSRL